MMRVFACQPEMNVDSVSNPCSLRTSELWAMTSGNIHTLAHTRIRNTMEPYIQAHACMHAHMHIHTSRERGAHWDSIYQVQTNMSRGGTHTTSHTDREKCYTTRPFNPVQDGGGRV